MNKHLSPSRGIHTMRPSTSSKDPQMPLFAEPAVPDNNIDRQ
jgi:hypothetical protein